ncbi:MAG: tandem-95 repeat protein, partial [Caldilineaceae bacterium]
LTEQDIVCESAGGSTFAFTSDAASDRYGTVISLAAGDDVTCTFTNTRTVQTLSINQAGNGSGSLSNDPSGTSFPYGTVVTLTATADTGSTFTGWSGDVSGSSNPVTVTIEADTAVTGTFTLEQYALTLATDGNGSGNVAADPDQTLYDYGTVVTLTATAETGSAFSGWSGDVSGSSNPVAVTIGADTAVTATFTVNAVNSAPVAVDDDATTNENTSVNIAVLTNDTDADGDNLTVVSITQPSNGSTAIEVDNTVTYTPTTGFSGSDSFTYTISDGNGGSATATVAVMVNSVNFLPLIVNDLAQTNEDSSVTVDVLANDSDPDGDALQIESVTAPTNGNAAIVNNMVVYTPTTNFNGVDSFTYTANDGNGGANTATVDITVMAVNDAPVATDDSATTDENAAVTIDVLANDSDVDGDTLTVESVTDPTNGAVVNNGTDLTYTPAANFSGSDSFTYTISDGNGGSNTATVTITVNAAATPFASCGGYDVFETAPGVYAAPGFAGALHVGTDGYDWLQGTDGPDLMLGLGGPDDIWGKKGNDVICGGDGVDIILGQQGDDTIYGDDQPDWLIGGPGNDTLYGGDGWDDLQGDGGNDVLYGEGGLDVLLGGAADDDLFGGDDPDALYGQNGNDDLDGGAADDYCKGGRGRDTITNCEGASAADATVDETEVDEEAARRSNDGEHGEHAIEQRLRQVFLPLITR